MDHHASAGAIWSNEHAGDQPYIPSSSLDGGQGVCYDRPARTQQRVDIG
jgi:hypothetical protein